MLFITHNGITLIALVITIIVMLILVSVTISMAVNGGLFGYAGRAAKETENAKQKELDWLNVNDNMSTDQLIEYYTSQPKEWTIAWVYRNNDWSNPYFKDKTLEDSFNFTDSEEYDGNIDTRYSLNSESDITGEFVVKLFNNGELTISGNGAIPPSVDPDTNRVSMPWLGYIHWDDSSQEYGENYYIMLHSNFESYLGNQISKVVFEEGITSIPYRAFFFSPCNDFEFPSTISEINSHAFDACQWLNDLWNEGPQYYDDNYWFAPYVKFEIYGKTFDLYIFTD